jgi:3-oxoacyl-[acyl-carrier-protein] synthase-3
MSQPISLIGVASYLPETVVPNDFFPSLTEENGQRKRSAMFLSPTTRRHVGPTETAVDMIEKAGRKLFDKLALDPARDVDIILTNVAIPDQAFTGCGAEVAHRLGAGPKWVFDLHNTGCISFVYMIEMARMVMASAGARSALLCNVQNAGGRLFAQPDVRTKPQAPVPGDGCGVAYLSASDVSPVVSLVQRCFGGYAGDMIAIADDQRRYWEPGTSAISVNFSEGRIASIFGRGNKLVPQIVREACQVAGLASKDIDLLITNQPNPIFLRNWREALELPKERHFDTFDKYGNLFGAGIPVSLDEAIEEKRLKPGDRLVLGGFAHAGDYAGAAVIHWQAARAESIRLGA